MGETVKKDFQGGFIKTKKFDESTESHVQPREEDLYRYVSFTAVKCFLVLR